MQRLFFAQIEAAETIIFLVEAKTIFNKGQPEIPKDEAGLDAKVAVVRAFVRCACKKASSGCQRRERQRGGIAAGAEDEAARRQRRGA